MEIVSCQQAFEKMTQLACQGDVRNYVQHLHMMDFTVETELFDRATLEAYSAWNLEMEVSDAQRALFSPERGGGQGDYRDGMQAKIDNVVDCLTHYPQSKRAVITIANDPCPPHNDDTRAKCLREIHCYLDAENHLSATVFFRAQAALIFPKNIHFIGSVMTAIAHRLPNRPALGTVFYLATLLVADRR